MGNCLCKDTPEELEAYNEYNHTRTENTILPETSVGTVASSNVSTTNFKFPTLANIDQLVFESLGVMGTLVDK